MNTATIEKLNVVSNTLASAMITDIKAGHTTSQQVYDIIGETKYPTKVEVVKSMIRKDRNMIDQAFGYLGMPLKISNILKTPRQLDYVAGYLVEKIQDAARHDCQVKDVMGGLLK